MLADRGYTFSDLAQDSGISEATLRGINKKPVEKWKISYVKALANLLENDISEAFSEILKVENYDEDLGKYNLESRRYIGSKAKLANWIVEKIQEETEGDSFLDLFGGTGIVTKSVLPFFEKVAINDFLYSNNIIYKAFFGPENYNYQKLLDIMQSFQSLKTRSVDDEYFSKSYGGKYFSFHDAEIIGEIRQSIENNKKINDREKSILIASLIYSADKVSNTVGHYEAYRKNQNIPDRFKFELIKPVDSENKEISIYREDANTLVRNTSADIVFVDPPYNSRQYSRFYHLLEVLTKWEKPQLTGVAMKPPVENISEYCKTSAPEAFDDLVKNISAKYIVVTYNNTYTSKSSSSQNKITQSQIIDSLNRVGTTKIYETDHKFFNAGKTEFANHKEFLFITKVK
ncbi:DNA adenine methylase [Rothia terrae]|uniref:site-specific DNA-methyltransferase (adenine-specific) n=1 Tax=Rothia terrae TaxID=396015 RepID=A0A7H2BGQ8_9MICC|nr:DNA adenine methylase [Rothia terrae]